MRIGEGKAPPARGTDSGDPQLLREFSAGQDEEGVRCLAVPMYGPKGRVVAAVSVSGPSSRLDSRRIPQILPHLKRISAAISSALAASQESTTQGWPIAR